MSDTRAPTRLPPAFGRRRHTPHVCIVDSKSHLRTFLAETFAELGFVAHACGDAAAVAAANAEHPCDLVVIALSVDDGNAAATLHTLAVPGFAGTVILIGDRHSTAVKAAQQLGEQLWLTMLPVLGTPFRAEELADRVAALRPSGPPPEAAVDVREALRSGWLDLWYQPKIDPRSLLTCGAEALIRLRHPTWGVVPPAYFIPADGDPHCRELSEFVVMRAMADWLYFAEHWVPVEIAINLPMTALQEPGFVEYLRRHLPGHPAFDGLIVEINGTEIVRDLSLARKIAEQLGSHNVGLSVDDLGAEWSSLAGLTDLPFVEIKVDRTFVLDCTNDRLKRAMCGTIVDLAERFRVRTVAEGVETRADLLTVRELKFDLVQGFLLGKPMEPRKFARTLLNRRVELLQ